MIEKLLTSLFLGNYVLMWKQQNRVLTAGTLVVRKDYRMRLKDDFSLELTQLKPDDQGTYTCEIDVMGKPISIKHKVSCIAGFIYCIIEWFCLWSFLNFYICSYFINNCQVLVYSLFVMLLRNSCQLIAYLLCYKGISRQA